MTTERRELHFENLEQVVNELSRLMESGYSQTGKWNLSQVCNHLSDWMEFSLDGYPNPPVPIRWMLWLMKVTVGRRQLEATLKNGFKDGLPTMPQTVPDAEQASDSEAVNRLTEVIDRYTEHSGPIHPSPLYGPLTEDEALRLHLVHCAHHLKFLTPNSQA